MGENTKIEWADATVNIWQGCAKVAPGCQNCYAEADLKRWGFNVWGKVKPRLYCANWFSKLRRLNNRAKRTGDTIRVFINSESDFFEEHRGCLISRAKDTLNHCQRCGWWGSLPVILPQCAKRSNLYGCPECDTDDLVEPLSLNHLREAAFQAFDMFTHLTLMLVTKRPENILRMWTIGKVCNGSQSRNSAGYRDNVWLLTSIATQVDADRNTPELLKCRDLVPVLGVSAEPLLEAVDLTNVRHQGCGTFDALDGRSWDESEPDGKSCSSNGGLDWIICGGESGYHARECRIEWIRSIRDQCQAAGVPCFIKQLGANSNYRVNGAIHATMTGVGLNCEHGYDVCPTCDGDRLDKLWDKKGGDWNEWPADLRVREFPKVESRV